MLVHGEAVGKGTKSHAPTPMTWPLGRSRVTFGLSDRTYLCT